VIASVAQRHEVSEELLATKTEREGSLNRNKIVEISDDETEDD
jgi:hypothetical protein